ncbi:MFS general substrate transporter [Trichoderma citrinoviride]|uniref:MFS general substrate transporter n=1 Tax=Trichoderma citrinoviride TaxID=58853 RepID=A0A2T4BE99_9HYPO|nr:MFS general substrate transporter [Trichoderma citrinoviride]PTB67635.1 MFS general substrate transporter [Trichoderma citrinoviride]
MSTTAVTTSETVLLEPLSPPAPTASIPRRSSKPDPPDPFPEPSVHDAESALPPSTAVSTAQRWNDPPRNKYRVLSCFFAFLVYGMNDGAPGAMVPLFGEYYHLRHSIVSLIFLSPMVGCVLASFASNRLHAIAGRRGVALTATGAYVLAYLGLSQHPPFPVVVFLLVLTGFGSGLMNGSWNSWVGGLVSGSTLLGFLHGFWGAGATLAPILVSRIATKVEHWWIFYTMMMGLACLACVGVTSSFWDDTGAGFHRHREAPLSHANAQPGTIKVLKNKVTLTFSAFMVLYVGSEVTIGGWLLTFMMSVRNGSPTASSLATSGFWIGLTVGRFALGWVTGYVGEKVMVTVYLLAAMGLELGFWLGREFAVSAVMAALVGVSIGMIMPSGIRLMTKLLPPEKHLVSVGFATAFAVSGSAVFPFAVGALAEAYGVEVLQPVALALFGSQLGLWLFISRNKLKV